MSLNINAVNACFLTGAPASGFGSFLGGSYALFPTPRVGVVVEFDRASGLIADVVNVIAVATVSEASRYA
jgi:hypothetical protein